MMEVFDAEKFIFEIRQRESIWNSQSAEYSDKNIKLRQWEEIVDIYGGSELSIEEKKKLGVTLQKKWKNIKDNFVKELKNREGKSGDPAKRNKNPYVYYNILLFLKDTVHINTTDTNIAEPDKEGSESRQDESRWVPKRNKKAKKDDDIGAQLIGVLNKNLEKKQGDDDEDRLFFLSLVKDFKKIPEHLRLQAKVDIIKVINEARFSYHYPNTYIDNPRYNNMYNQGPSRGYISGNVPEIQTHRYQPNQSPGAEIPFRSPVYMDSPATQTSNESNETASTQSEILTLFADQNQ